MCEKDVQWHRDTNGPLKTPRSTDGPKTSKTPKLIEQTDYQPIFDQSSSGCSVGSAPTTSSSCSSPFEQQQQFYLPYPTAKTPLLSQLLCHVQEYFKSERALYTMLHPEKEDGNVIVVSSLDSVV